MTEQTDRRDRYAAAIWARYPDTEPSRTGLVMANPHGIADAVMAVADAEQAELRAQVSNLRVMYDVASARENDLIEERDRFYEEHPTAEGRVRAVLETEAVTGRTALEYRGLILSALMASDVSAAPAAEEQPESETPDAPVASAAIRRTLRRWAYAAGYIESELDATADRMYAAIARDIASQAQPGRKTCTCEHPPEEHSIYGCDDGCACEWMPKRRKRPPMDPAHILGVDAPPAVVPQPEEATAPETVCVCSHAHREHITVSGRLLCDACDPDSTDNLVCRGFDAL